MPSSIASRLQMSSSTVPRDALDRKSTRLNSSHSQISYAVFCLKKKNNATMLTNYFLSAIPGPAGAPPAGDGGAARPRPAALAVKLAVGFFFNDTATTEIYTLSLHDALPI